jgi:transposase
LRRSPIYTTLSSNNLPALNGSPNYAQKPTLSKPLPACAPASARSSHPLILRAIAAAKKKNDRIDAHKIAVLLMEAGVSYNKQKLHKVGYFRELLVTNSDIDAGLKPLLRLCRETVVRLGRTESALVRSLQRDSLLMERVERLMTIPAVGPITAPTWALEVGDV